MRICTFGFRGFPLVEGGVEKHCESLYPLISKKHEYIVFRRKPYVKTKDTYEGIRFIDLLQFPHRSEAVIYTLGGT